jgi:hypothetical protein
VYRKTYYDHREFERLPISFSVSIWGESGEHGHGTLQDLSIKGCRLATAVAFRQGNILRLELHVPNDTVPIVVQAAVVRNIGAFHCEIEFLQLHHAERERLRAMVKGLLASRDAKLEHSKDARA